MVLFVYGDNSKFVRVADQAGHTKWIAKVSISCFVVMDAGFCTVGLMKLKKRCSDFINALINKMV